MLATDRDAQVSHRLGSGQVRVPNPDPTANPHPSSVLALAAENARANGVGGVAPTAPLSGAARAGRGPPGRCGRCREIWGDKRDGGDPTPTPYPYPLPLPLPYFYPAPHQVRLQRHDVLIGSTQP